MPSTLEFTRITLINNDKSIKELRCKVTREPYWFDLITVQPDLLKEYNHKIVVLVISITPTSWFSLTKLIKNHDGDQHKVVHVGTMSESTSTPFGPKFNSVWYRHEMSVGSK